MTAMTGEPTEIEKMTDHMATLESYGYRPIKRLANGEFAGVMNYLFTAGICVGLDETGWRTRFCYETRREAEAALEAWDGSDDPPGLWIKQKPEERHGPGSAARPLERDEQTPPPGSK